MNCNNVWTKLLGRLSTGLGMIAILTTIAGTSFADLPDGVNIIHVEEDWVVELNTPDPDDDAPQIVTAMSSTNQLADVHALFEINHRTLPDYQAGGLSLQCWSGDWNLDYGAHGNPAKLSTAGEKITFTSSMKLDDGYIIFDIKNGNSTTWGTFGGEGYLRNSVTTPQTSFTLYSPLVSVANSRVAFAGHRVKRLYLKEVRYYSALGLVATDSTQRTAHEHHE